jgi:hypothetical protein
MTFCSCFQTLVDSKAQKRVTRMRSQNFEFIENTFIVLLKLRKYFILT